MVDKGDPGVIRQAFLEQRFDELEQVINLFELASAILVHLPVPGQDVQFFEQGNGLAGAYFIFVRHGVDFRMAG
ncbi:hypothetical protein GCM10011289_20280 [Paludibacterium paludis]|uniref:Uncharacterized protein n=1 Tax=Paludibacterium paludis TaxID=1225769 RepID=A0A918UAD0_9NEIS|nr:hypothetical protein GCM10011289_20280 [Paludibacterium paludis]